MSTEPTVWDELRARWAEANPDLDSDAAPAVAPAEPGAASAVAQDAPAAAQDAYLVPDPDGWTDPLTGTEGPRSWDRIIAKEEARRRRYGRDVTVALVQLTGFEGDRVWYSRELAMQFFARIARALAKEVRTSDHVARIGPVRFGIVLLETDEIRAINFIDRLRAACRNQFWAGSGLGIRTGWASASEVGGLGAAVVLAGERLVDAAYQEAPELPSS